MSASDIVSKNGVYGGCLSFGSECNLELLVCCSHCVVLEFDEIAYSQPDR